MRKPIPYKKVEEKKPISKKKIFYLISFEITIILISIVIMAMISLLFGVAPYISSIISGFILVFSTIFICKEVFYKKN